MRAKDPEPLTVESARANCHRDRAIGGRWPLCQLPDDCVICKMYQCNRCEGVYPWWFGGGDEAPGLCDACWVAVAKPWHDAQDNYEAKQRQLRLLAARSAFNR